MLDQQYAGQVRPAALRRIGAFTKALKQRALETLELTPAQRILDVGCGIGIDTLAFARVVGPCGFVAGVDHDPAAVGEAEREARRAGVASWARHQLADAVALPFADGCFDVCHSQRLCQHLVEVKPAISEMARVTKPNGRVAVVDCDWATLSIDAPDAALERRVVRALQQLIANGYAGRQLPRLLRGESVGNLRVETYPIQWTDYQTFRHTTMSMINVDDRLTRSGHISRGDLQRFLSSLAETDHAGSFYATATMTLVVGTKM